MRNLRLSVQGQMLHRIHDLLGLEVPSGMKSIQVHGPPSIIEKEEE